MIRDWRPLIVKMIEVQQAVSEADKEKLWEYHWPRVAASEATLDEVERHLGFKLDPEYREFLATADGWPWISHSVVLFGSAELLGSPEFLAASATLDVSAVYLQSHCGAQRASVFPIAASLNDKDVFFMYLLDGVLQPPIVWLAGEEIERYPTFLDFFTSLIEYNKLEIDALSR